MLQEYSRIKSITINYKAQFYYISKTLLDIIPVVLYLNILACLQNYQHAFKK